MGRFMQLRARCLLLLLAAPAIAACAPDEGTDPLSPALWSSASAAAGSESIQLSLVLTRAGEVHWSLHALPQEGMTAEQVVAGPAGALRTGRRIVASGETGDTVRVVIDELAAGTAYHAYVAATAADPDPVPDDLARVEHLAVTLAERQPGQSHASASLGQAVGYYAYLPEPHYLDPTARLPLLIFLHGSGEKGNGTTELSRVAVHGPPRLVRNGRDLPFVVISPQLPASQGSWPAGLVDELVTRAIADYRIDTTRIYVTGLSLGGFGTWNYARSYPGRVAAVVPIAGGGSTGTAICTMRDVPVWAFHGDADGTVNMSGTVNSVNALNACSPAPSVAPTLTIYPGVGHDSWSRTYDGSAGHDIYAWLLQYRR